MALEIWGQLALAFPLKWTALLPLIELQSRSSAVLEAVPSVEAMLHESQQQLPGIATDSLRRFLRHCAANDMERAESALQLALRVLDQTDFR